MQEAKPGMGSEEVAAFSWSELRDQLIAHAPLECDWIKRVNRVSAIKHPLASKSLNCNIQPRWSLQTFLKPVRFTAVRGAVLLLAAGGLFIGRADGSRYPKP